MTVSTRSMALYVAVLDFGSFSEVARRENMSPSSISRVVHNMETALGTQLLHRNTRAVAPTEAGRLYGATFKKVLAQLGEAAEQLQEGASEPSGLVRINAPVVFGQKHIAPWLSELTMRYPRLRIELVQTDDFVNPVSEPVDLLFRIGPLQDSGFHVRVLDKAVYYLAASPAYLAAHGVPRTPSQLLSHNCLVYKGVMGPQRSFFRQDGGAAQVMTLAGSLVSNNAETLVSAALRGAGIVMMPDWQIGESLLSGALVRVLPSYEVSTRLDDQVIAILYPHARFLPLSLRTVIDFFASKFGSPPYWKGE